MDKARINRIVTYIVTSAWFPSIILRTNRINSINHQSGRTIWCIPVGADYCSNPNLFSTIVRIELLDDLSQRAFYSGIDINSLVVILYEYMFMYKRCRCTSKRGSCCGFDEELDKLSGDLTLLSVKSRLDILFSLKDKPHCVCDLTTHTKMSQSLLSHHLSDLTAAGLIEGRREGKFIDYYLTEKGRQTIKTLLLLIREQERR